MGCYIKLRFNPFELALGLILTLILSISLGLILGSPGSFAGFLIATFIVGYRVGDDIAQGAAYGAVVCIAAGIVFTITMVSMASYPGGLGSSMMEMGFSGMLVGVMLNGIIGSIGGILGSYVRDRFIII